MDWSVFPLFLAACGAAAATGAMFSPGAWYADLSKPRWTPRDWMFPVAWTIIYLSSALAATRIATLDANSHAMGFWAMQIAFNTLWTPIFFGLKRIKASMAVMVGLWVSVVGTFVSFMMLDALAGWLIAPYVAWVTVAGALNATVWRLNPDKANAVPAE